MCSVTKQDNATGTIQPGVVLILTRHELGTDELAAWHEGDEPSQPVTLSDSPPEL